eukprot:TRINITY_DN4823_c0_g1_i8.p1 TRINITY_DN4823_c0_g1~~TRINITY_DN4823_c0_g1_i8.p1  ORF type:complete len:470 (+),score=76.63 TRINITY_DN4823_c0_g1_i8:286-1695(+)
MISRLLPSVRSGVSTIIGGGRVQRNVTPLLSLRPVVGGGMARPIMAPVYTTASPRASLVGRWNSRHFRTSPFLLSPEPAARQPASQAPSDLAATCVAGAVVLVALVGGYYVFLHETEQDVVNAMVSAFEKGEVTLRRVYEPAFDRPHLHASIEATLLRDQVTVDDDQTVEGKYHLVVGKVGSGKTSAMLKSISNLSEPRGVVFVSLEGCLPSNVPVKLAKAVDFRIPETFFAVQTPLSRVISLKMVEDALVLMSHEYKEKHDGQIPVLVIDGVDSLTKSDPARLRDLQSMAKRFADKRGLAIVFVSSEGHVLPLFQSTSLVRRLSTPFEIPDVPHDEAVNFLCARGVQRDRAVNAVTNIVGGHIMSLACYADDVRRGESDEEILHVLDEMTGRAFLRVCRAEPDSVKALQTALSDLVEPGEVDQSVMNKAVGEKVFAALVQENILEAHPVTVSFHSPHVRNMVKSGQYL